MKKVILLLVTIGLVSGFSTLEGKAQSEDQQSGWIKTCVFDKLRDRHLSIMTIFSKKSEAYGPLNNSKAVVTITDMYREDAGSNCSKPNYNALAIEVDGFDVVPCKTSTDSCQVSIRFDDEPVQSFTPFYLEGTDKTDNSEYALDFPALIHQFETHHSAIIEISTVEGTTEYEFDLRGFDQPLVTNTNE